ncbi:AraC family transcriptional regulator [Achromobacter animicus]|uniref:AraC family transcriptional regulator n=1 Tax=Achromobacter animicus TaxID=1389935 RepID=UPI0028AA4520|nr:helix-turn-helix domain-containing protein [Achromobacter animicus]
MELQRFESFGEFEDAVVDVDLKVRLLGPGDGSWRLGHAKIGGITIQRGVETVPNLCEASGWPGHLIFLISSPEPSSTWLNGVPFGEGKLGVLAPGRGFVFRAAGPNHWITVALPLTSWLLHTDNEAGRVLRRWCKSTFMLHAPPSSIQTLQRAAVIASASLTSEAVGRTMVENAILSLALSRNDRPRFGRPGVSPHAVCDATLGLLDAADTGRLQSLLDLPIGSRTLRNFFHNCFGQGPAQYLHLRRLHAIHESLRAGREGLDSIADTFEQHGYAYSSYALARYRAIFGELPSMTRGGKPKSGAALDDLAPR